MSRGGARERAGRPPVPTGTAKKMRSMRLSDKEYEQVKEFVKKIKKDAKLKDVITN